MSNPIFCKKKNKKNLFSGEIKKNTVDPRYLYLAYLELPIISK